MAAFHPHCLGQAPIIAPGMLKLPHCPSYCIHQGILPYVDTAAFKMQITPCYLPASLLSVTPITLHVEITLLSLVHLPLTLTYCLISPSILSYFQYLDVTCSLSTLKPRSFLPPFPRVFGGIHHSSYMGIPKPLTLCCNHSHICSAHAYKGTFLKLFIFVNGFPKRTLLLHLIF